MKTMIQLLMVFYLLKIKMRPRHIFLIGYMGCGKSHWGRLLADSLNIDFIDLDRLIEKRGNMSVSRIFKLFGELCFRKEEQSALLSIGDLQHATVIATGGGVPCFENNMSLMKALGVTVFLEASPATLKKNVLRSKGKRPILRNIPENELEAYISKHLNERLPFYEQADIKINVEDLIFEDWLALFK